MKMIFVAVVGALLVTSFASVAEETRMAVNEVKREPPRVERVELKRPQPARRVQKRTAKPAKHDTSLDWPQLG